MVVGKLGVGVEVPGAGIGEYRRCKVGAGDDCAPLANRRLGRERVDVGAAELDPQPGPYAGLARARGHAAAPPRRLLPLPRRLPMIPVPIGNPASTAWPGTAFNALHARPQMTSHPRVSIRARSVSICQRSGRRTGRGEHVMTGGAQAFGRGEYDLPQPVARMEHHHPSHSAIVSPVTPTVRASKAD
jgi:hypothetical protein